jgi:hypothetical protein
VPVTGTHDSGIIVGAFALLLAGRALIVVATRRSSSTT